MRPAKRAYKRPGFDRAKLPSPTDYFESEGVKLTGGGAWRDAVCPFHKDTKPSLRVRVETGAYLCFSCGAAGGDVLAFHMQRHELNFVTAAKQLGAWGSA
jgi:DNA primase